jgi:sigma-B regulation protein RsbU (phosphoserine phosphatase)
MSKLTRHIRDSLSVRLGLWIVLFATVIFMITLGFMFYESRKAIRQEAINHATQILENTAERVNTILTKVVVATDNTDWLACRHLDAPDSMFVYSRRILVNNPDLNGCSIAFEPYFFKDRGRYFSAYSVNKNGNIETTQEGDELYEYFYMDWYQLPKLLGRPCWTEPYTDLTIDEYYSPKRIISYCKPMKDKQGNYVGTMSVDLSLDSLSKTISAVKPYPHSYSIMIGQSGTYFVHPDTTKLFYQSIFTETLERPDSDVTALGHAMQNGETGMRQMKVDGKDCYVFYKPLGTTGWSVAIVCTESDIFGGYFQLIRIVVGLIAVGLLIMLFVFSRIIHRELAPLRQLAHEAETIASGHFDEELPPTGRNDEIGMLSSSFSNMQQSLTNYIAELKKTTASKAQIEGELQIASNIQMSMLPKTFPAYPARDDIDILGQLMPAKEVGGDLYDFFIRDEKLFFCIGDVAGKGVPASLVMAVTRTLFRTVSTHESQPERVMAAINKAIAEDNDSNMFVTIFMGVLDLPTGRLRYCNGGHDAPLLIGDSGIGPLPCDSNLPVGIVLDWKYTQQETMINYKTTIFLYTDGLTEAENIRHEQFQDERVLATARQCERKPELFISRMTQAVHEFVGDAEQSDDLTMLAIQYTCAQEQETMLTRTITLPNDIEKVPQLASFVDEVCEVVGFDPSTTMGINLAIEEAVVNVMSYAYPSGTRGNVDIEAKANDRRLKFTISDWGIPFDPTAKPEADITLSAEERPIGGLGIHLVRQIMDSINYERVDGKNVLTLRKSIV